VKVFVRRLLVVAALLVLASVGLDALADATQTRPDVHHADRRTEFVLDIEGQHFRQDLHTGATALWATCSATVSGDLTPEGIVDEGNGRFRFSIVPSLGVHGTERITGCLRDLTVERLRADVVSVRELPR
jgi:hypothetical protein